MTTKGEAIAARVLAGLQRAGAKTGSGTYVCALRKVAADGAATDPATPWDQNTRTYTYSDLTAVEEIRTSRNKEGRVGESKRVLLVAATGSEPLKADWVAPGVLAANVDGNTVWHEILEVRKLAPAGTALLYELDLEL